jgi:beta-xylosidase
MNRRDATLLMLALIVGGISLAAISDRKVPQREHIAAATATDSAEVAAGVEPVPKLHVPAASRFADPAILAVGNRYYAYATRNGAQNIPVMLSTDLAAWTLSIDALPRLPEWAGGRTWAPTVLRLTSPAARAQDERADGERYVMWYTARDRTSARQCISVAVADGPLGPFVDSSTRPAICQVELGGSIDPEVFVDGGKAYLLWKSDDNALGNATTLWAAPLNSEGTSVGTHVRLLAASSGWHSNLIEGPAMAVDRGAYYLFYGANRWNSAAAAIGYAACTTPLGPCTDVTSDAPWLASMPTALGPSGPHIFRDVDGKQRIAYHAWDGCIGSLPCNRSLYFGALAFTGGRPLIRS